MKAARIAAAGLCVAAACWLAGPAVAAADPAAPAPGPGFAQCGGQLVPLDPRVSIENPLGTLIFQAFLNAMCGNNGTVTR